jgi:hypothetical protein
MVVSPDMLRVSRLVGIPDEQLTFRDCGIIYMLLQQFGSVQVAAQEFRRQMAIDT